MTLISSVTVGSGGAANIDFTSIPSTYTDLVLVTSLRQTGTGSPGDYVKIQFNGETATTNYSGKYLEGNGTSATSGNLAQWGGVATGSSATSNTFSNCQIYIPNYAGSIAKSYSVDDTLENNATSTYMDFFAGLWNNTTAINRVNFVCTSGTFVQYSTAYLYGVKSS